MRSRLLWLLARLALLLSLIALSPVSLDAFAATPGATQQHPHFFWKSNVHHQQPDASTAAASNVTWHTGPIMPGTTQVYAIFWEPTGNVSASYNSLLERYFQDVGGSSLYHNNTQYYDRYGHNGTFFFDYPANSVFAGAWVDNGPYPESPLLDGDIQNEVNRGISVFGPPSLHHPGVGGINTMFFVFTEAGQNLCYDSTHAECASNAICAYHSAFEGYDGQIAIYAAMPYTAGFNCDPGGPYPNDRAADLTINVTSHEQMEATTDPALSAWYDGSSFNGEIGDKCNFVFGPRDSTGADVTWNGHSYLVQQEWDNQVSGCVLSGP